MVVVTFHLRRKLLLLANVILATGTVVVAGLAVLWPLDVDAHVAPPPDRPVASTQPVTSPRLLSSYAAIWTTKLNQPLFDAPPPAPEVPKLSIELAGTAVEDEAAYAFFRTPEGAVKMVAVGQSIDGAELLEVTTKTAVVRFAGRRFTLTTAKGEEGEQ